MLLLIFQGSLSGFRCEGLSYQSKIIVNINNKSPLKSAELQCCYTDGCNWNITTARSNTSLPEILASYDESLLSASVDWVPIVLICLIGEYRVSKALKNLKFQLQI